MKSMLTLIRNAGFWLLAPSTLSPQLSTTFARGTAFIYQGRPNDGEAAANETLRPTRSLSNFTIRASNKT